MGSTAVFCTACNFAATGLLSLTLTLTVPTAAQSQGGTFWDTGAVTLLAATSLVEGRPGGYLQFQLSHTTNAATSLPIKVGGTAVYGDDYTFGNVRYSDVNGLPVTDANGASYADGTLTVTIPSGTTHSTDIFVDINASDDSTPDNGETIILTINNTNSLGVGKKYEARITIYEDSDDPAAYQISGDPHVGGMLTLTKTRKDPDGGVQTPVMEWRKTTDGQIYDTIKGGPGVMSHTLTIDESGLLVDVVVMYTDGNGNRHSVVSNSLGPIGSARPRVTSIERLGASPTAADSLTWRVLFSEPVKDVDATDFSLSGSTASLSVATVTGVDNAYDVKASGGDLAGLQGEVTLGFAPGQNIKKNADDVALRDTTPTGTNEPTYVVENPGVTLTESGGAMEVKEDGSDTASYDLVLATEPAHNVTLTVTARSGVEVSKDGGSSYASNQTLTFANTNWNTAQTITIRGVDDGVDHESGGRNVIISHATSSTDPKYNNLFVDSIAVRVTDQVKNSEVRNPGVTLTESGGSTEVKEDGSTTDSYDLVLATEPTDDVTLTVSAGSGVEVSTDGGSSYASSQTVTFTRSGAGLWSAAQTITVRGVEDGVDHAEGARTVTISHATSSTDPGYNNLSVDSIAVRVTDQVKNSEVRNPGVTLTESGGSTEVKEDRSDTDSYDLVLATEPTHDVTLTVTAGSGVEVSTDGGSSYASSQTVTFTRSGDGLWSAAQTITLCGVDDGEDNPGGSRTVIIGHATSSTDPRYNSLSVDSVDVRVTDVMDERLTTAARAVDAGLIRFGRTVGQQVVGAVRDRVGADRTSGFVSRLAGETLPLIAEPSESSESSGRPNQEYVRPHRFDHDPHQSDGFGRENDTDVIRALSDEDALRGTAFTLTTMGDEGSSLAFWGEGSISQFRGTDDGLSLEGEIRDIMLGADRSWSNHLVGALVMGSRGEITYSMGDDTGRLDTSLTSLVPYGGWHARNGLTYWGAAGIGRGTMTVTPEGEDPFEGPIDWHMVSGGVEGSLSNVSLLPEARLVWHSDVLWTRTTSEPVGDLPSLGGETTRVRLGVDATWPERSLLDGFVTPEVGMGIRYDGGDAETGFGLEVRGGLRWRDPQGHLGLSVSGRTLVVHDDGAFKDWGVRFGVFWDPHPATKKGISAAFSYDLGDGVDGDALLGPAVFPDQRASEGRASWRSEVAYGVSRGGGMVGSPYGGIGGTSAAIDEARIGYRIEPDTPQAENMRIDVWTDLVAENEEQSIGAGLTWSW